MVLLCQGISLVTARLCLTDSLLRSGYLGTPELAAQAACARIGNPRGGLLLPPIQHSDVQLLGPLKAYECAIVQCSLSLAQIRCNACCGVRRHGQCSLHSVQCMILDGLDGVRNACLPIYCRLEECAEYRLACCSTRRKHAGASPGPQRCTRAAARVRLPARLPHGAGGGPPRGRPAPAQRWPPTPCRRCRWRASSGRPAPLRLLPCPPAWRPLTQHSRWRASRPLSASVGRCPRSSGSAHTKTFNADPH